MNGLQPLGGEGDDHLTVVQGVGEAGDQALVLHAVEKGGDPGGADHQPPAQVHRVGLVAVGEKIVQHEVLPLGELGNQVPGGHPEEVLIDLEQFCG